MSVPSPAIYSTFLRATAVSHGFIISFRNCHSPVSVCFDSPLSLTVFFHFTKKKNSQVFPLASFASAATIPSSSFLSTLYSIKTTGWSPSLPFLLPFTLLIQTQQLLQSLTFIVIQTLESVLILHSSSDANCFSWLVHLRFYFWTSGFLDTALSWSHCCCGCHSKEQLHVSSVLCRELFGLLSA